MTVDPLLLARIGLGATLSAAVVFATVAIGLGWMAAALALRHGAEGDAGWRRAHAGWTRLFALSFALAALAAAGTLLQVETGWPGLAKAAGPAAAAIAGRELPALLFLAGIVFTGAAMFGPSRLPQAAVTTATVLAATMATAAAVPLVALVAWMQTPAGFELAGGAVRVTNPLAALMNPAFPHRLGPPPSAAGAGAGVPLAGGGAPGQVGGGRGGGGGRRAARPAGAPPPPGAVPSRRSLPADALLYQPAKIAAIAAHWTSSGHAPLVLVAWPDEAALANRLEVSIPDGASLILRHRADGTVPGVDNYRGEHPPVAPVFFSFRIMAALGLLMLVAAWTAAGFLWRRGSLPRPVAALLSAMALSGPVAVFFGWATAQVGRQPWAVAEVLRTADAAAAPSAAWAALSLAGWLAFTCALAALWLAVLWRMATRDEAADVS